MERIIVIVEKMVLTGIAMWKSLVSNRDSRINIRVPRLRKVKKRANPMYTMKNCTSCLLLLKSMGMPVFSSKPPGRVKRAAKLIVPMRVATIIKLLLTCLAAFSACSRRAE